jgi:hypothetical protein
MSRAAAPSPAPSVEEIVYPARTASTETLDVVLYPLSSATVRAPARSVPWDDRSDWDPVDDRSLAASDDGLSDGTEDYVLLPRPRQPFTVEMLAPALAGLRVREETVTPASFAAQGRVQSPTPPPSPPPPSRRRRKARNTLKIAPDAPAPAPAAKRQMTVSVSVLVEDDGPDAPSPAALAAAYDEAANYITQSVPAHLLRSAAR